MVARDDAPQICIAESKSRNKKKSSICQSGHCNYTKEAKKTVEIQDQPKLEFSS
jgi:hypothetical protein